MVEYNDAHLYEDEPKGIDDEFDVDVSDVLDDSPVPDGEYVLEAIDLRIKREGRRLKNITLVFRIAEGEYEDREVTDFLNFGNEFGRKIAFRALRALGCLVEEDGKRRLRGRKEDVVGKRIGAYLAQDTYKGETRSRPRRYFPADEVGKSDQPDV